MIQSSFVIHSLYICTCRLGLKGKVDVTLQIKVHVYMYMYICMINTFPEQSVVFNETNRAALGGIRTYEYSRQLLSYQGMYIVCALYMYTYSTNDGQTAAIYMYTYIESCRNVHLLCPIGEEIGAGGGVELSCSHGDKDGKDVQKTRLIGTQSSGMFMTYG